MSRRKTTTSLAVTLALVSCAPPSLESYDQSCSNNAACVVAAEGTPICLCGPCATHPIAIDELQRFQREQGSCLSLSFLVDCSACPQLVAKCMEGTCVIAGGGS
jgi:hypothetical protein